MDLAYGSAWASTDRSRLARMIVWQESDVSDYRRFPARPVPTRPPVFRFRRSAAADRVPVATVPVRKGGRLVERDLERFLRSTGTTAFLAIKGDTLVSEVYFNDPNAPKANSIVPSVTAIVPNDRGELLLVHKTDNDLWALPGGGMDVGESMADTVVREVKEETGIDVEVTGVVGIYTNPNHVMAYDDGEVRQQCSICFTTRMLGGQLATSSETSEVECVAPDAAGQPQHPSVDAAADRPLPGAAQRALHRLSQPDRRAAAGSDRSLPGAAAGPEQWPGAPGHQVGSGAESRSTRCSRVMGWPAGPVVMSAKVRASMTGPSSTGKAASSSTRSRSSASERAPE